MPNDAFEMLCVSTDSMIRPGTMNAPYGISPIFWMREPIAEPNTTK